MSIANYGLERAPNPARRLPVVLLLDTSESMGRPLDKDQSDGKTKIAALNEALQDFASSLKQRPATASAVEVTVITFDSHVRVLSEWVLAAEFTAPILSAQYQTWMGTAIEEAVQMIKPRKQFYKRSAVPYNRPLIWMITDGMPEGEPHSNFERAVQLLHQNVKERHLEFYGIGVRGANMERLRSIAGAQTFALEGLEFQRMFQELSDSLQRASSDRNQLPDMMMFTPAPHSSLQPAGSS